MEPEYSCGEGDFDAGGTRKEKSRNQPLFSGTRSFLVKFLGGKLELYEIFTHFLLFSCNIKQGWNYQV